ncbi:MAG: hypothetical protein ACMUIU_00360 [bacterium]
MIIDDISKEVFGKLGSGWIVSCLIPSAILFAVIGIALFIEPPHEMIRQHQALQRLCTSIPKTWWPGVIILLIIFTGLCLKFCTPYIIRFYEGYGPFSLFRPLEQRRFRNIEKRLKAFMKEVKKTPRTNTNTSEFQQLEQKAHALEYHLRSSFPPPEYVMPTALGNIIRAAEIHGLVHYGIDAIILWPRLLPFVPEKITKALGEAYNSMVLCLNTSIIFYTLSLFWLIYFGRLKNITTLIFLPVPILFLLGCLSYKASLTSGRDFGHQLCAAVDLSRWKLLKELRYPYPKDHNEEVQLWQEISKFLYGGPPVQRNYKYEHKDLKDS